MKTRVIISIIMISLCICLCLFGYYTEKSVLTKLEKTLEAITEGEYISAQAADELNEFWIENKSTLSSVLKHEDIDSLDVYINEIVYGIKNNGDEYLSDTDETLHFIDEMLRNEKVNIANIF